MDLLDIEAQPHCKYPQSMNLQEAQRHRGSSWQERLRTEEGFKWRRHLQR